MTPRDLVVLGGGVIGLAVARRAAERGMSVTLVDQARPGLASGVGAGMLAPVTEVHYGEERLLALNLESSERYPAWVEALEASTGLATGYTRCGTVMVARDADDDAALGDVFAFQRALGLQVERLRSREVRALEPGLAPSVRGGILVEGDHQVDGQALLRALRAAASSAGVEFAERRAVRVGIAGDRVSGVDLDDGTAVSSGAVVVACGAWSASLEGVPPGLLPVRAVKGQLLRLERRRDPLPIGRNVRGLDVYLVPRADGRLVVGATVEEQGEDVAATAGAVYELLRRAYELVPGVTEAAFVEVAVGLRPGTPDNAPLIGETGIQGLIAATGHHRNGILLAPVTADEVVELLISGRSSELIAPFSPLRFRHDQVSA